MRIIHHFPHLVMCALMAGMSGVEAAAAGQSFRAGACAMDVTPTNFPVIVNGGFLAAHADRARDPLHMRWLVLDDGRIRVALGVLDSCLIPAEFAEAVKVRAEKLTGIPSQRIMISATHTHSAPSLMQALGTPVDPNYPAFLLPRIVEGLQQAVGNLAPARVGWTVTSAPELTHTRVWIRRPDKMMTDPFGELSVRANMHPGYQSPDVIAPSGPSDPAVTLLAVQSLDGRPMAVLANYAMHYFGSAPVSADYYGAFAAKFSARVGGSNASPAFVGIMSQGFSGDQHWMDYSQPKRAMALGEYADQLVSIAFDAYQKIAYHDRVPLVMRESELRLATRQPDGKRLAWAQDVVEKMGDRMPKDRSEVYAREQLWIKANPVRRVKLQALRVGDFGITATPCEVFALSSLKLKAQSPLQPTMNIELANGEEGYIPPPELHKLGGYNTWACRSAGLEVNAETKIVDALLGLLEKVSGKPRQKVVETHGPYAQAILAAKPLVYWRMNEFGGPVALDASGAKRNGVYEDGVLFHLNGPQSASFSGAGVVNCAAHFAGGRLKAGLKDLGATYSVELWFWNGLPESLRPVTGCLFGRGDQEYLALGGSGRSPGKLIFGDTLAGSTPVGLKTWNHVVLVRDGVRVTVYLNGNPTPEITGEATPAGSTEIFIGGRADKEFSFEGKIDEVAIYPRALSPEEVHRHHQLAAVGAP